MKQKEVEITSKIYLECLRERHCFMKAAGPDVLLHTKPPNAFCLTGDGRLCAYVRIPQKGKVESGDPQAHVKNVKSLAHVEAENNCFR